MVLLKVNPVPIHTLHQILATFAVSNYFILAGIETGWPAAVLPKLLSGEIPIKVSDEEISWIVALKDLGAVMSPIPASYLMDRRGRLTTLRVGSFLFVTASIFSLVATNPYYLYLARIFGGLGRGISYTVVPTYIAEIASPHIRGTLIGACVGFAEAGTAFTMTFGPYCSFDAINWAILAFGINSLLFSFLIQESPHYYLMRNLPTAAEKSFYWVRPRDDNAVLELMAINNKIEEERRDRCTYFTMFRSAGNRKAFKLLFILYVYQKLGGMPCLQSYASTSLPAYGVWDPKITVLFFGWASFFGGFQSSLLIDRLGRKPLVLFSGTMMGIVMAVIATFYFFYDRAEANVRCFIFVPHLGVILFAFLFTLGAQPIPAMLRGELFPTNVRARASAIAGVLASLNAFIGNKFYLSVGHAFGMEIAFAWFSLVNFFTAVYYELCMFETKGLSLIEIQNILNSKKETELTSGERIKRTNNVV